MRGSGAITRRDMTWRATTVVELPTEQDDLDARIHDLELSLIIGRSRPQWAGERTTDVKWQIAEACFWERLPWEM
jgi:hypothetical protein